MAHYPTNVYLNGKIIRAEDAKISVFDRGFLFGDGVYEVMAQLGGRFFNQQAHYSRLTNSLTKISIDFDVNTLPDKIERLLRASDLVEQDCLLYLQITRGIAPRHHAYPAKSSPSLMMYALAREFPDINESNLTVITLNDFRWSRCDIKMISLLGNVMANNQAIREDAYEALLVREGKITEASHSNAFFVKDGIVYTHPANEYILNGINRQVVIKLCQDLGIEVREEAVALADLAHMDEVFLTGTTTLIASVRRVDQLDFYQNEERGPVTRKIQQGYQELRAQHRRQSATRSTDLPAI